MTPDGKLGLIDYGQVKLWNKKTAREYGETLALLREDDKDKIVEMGLRSGFTTERNDPFVIYKSMVVTMVLKILFLTTFFLIRIEKIKEFVMV